MKSFPIIILSALLTVVFIGTAAAGQAVQVPGAPLPNPVTYQGFGHYQLSINVRIPVGAKLTLDRYQNIMYTNKNLFGKTLLFNHISEEERAGSTWNQYCRADGFYHQTSNGWGYVVLEATNKYVVLAFFPNRIPSEYFSYFMEHLQKGPEFYQAAIKTDASAPSAPGALNVD